jgi:hypothetical protein
LAPNQRLILRLGKEPVPDHEHNDDQPPQAESQEWSPGMCDGDCRHGGDFPELGRNRSLFAPSTQIIPRSRQVNRRFVDTTGVAIYLLAQEPLKRFQDAMDRPGSGYHHSRGPKTAFDLRPRMDKSDRNEVTHDVSETESRGGRVLPMAYRFRFTLGQLMGFIAISALLTANAIFISRGNFTFLSLISAALSCVWLGVLFSNRRLSGWIWVWIAGYTAPLLWWGGQALAFVLLPSPYYSHNAFLAIQTTLSLRCSLLGLLGFAMTFRDIRHRLAIYEDASST